MRPASAEEPPEYQFGGDGRDLDFGAGAVLAKGKGGKDVILAGQKSGHVWALDADTGEIVDVPELEVDGVPLGQYVEFKVRVTDDDGEFSDLDMVLSPTENAPPTFDPPDEGTTYEMSAGTPTTIPLEASSPDSERNVSFSLSGQPEWVNLNQTPGNPAKGSITVNPPPTVTGTFVINVNANDDAESGNHAGSRDESYRDGDLHGHTDQHRNGSAHRNSDPYADRDSNIYTNRNANPYTD